MHTELSGKRVLVVDDDIGFGKALVEALRAEGAVAFGPALTTFHANCLLGRRRVDLALLDTSLYGKSSGEFAMELRARAIPVMFMSDADAPALQGPLAQSPVLAKPIATADALSQVSAYLGETNGHEALRVVHAQPRPRSESSQSALHRLARCVAVTLERSATR